MVQPTLTSVDTLAIRHRLLTNAPDYINMLIATNFLDCKVTDYTPDNMAVIAWTKFDEDSGRWTINFHSRANELSNEAQAVLWRHEVGHISLGHFNKEMCTPDNPKRSQAEAFVVSDLQINYYLLPQKYAMYEIGKVALDIHTSNTGEEVDGCGFIDPEELLPSYGVELGEYSYETLHAYVHDTYDDSNDNNIGMCGGIELGDPSNDAKAQATIISIVAGANDESFSKLIGNNNADAHIYLRENKTPTWVNSLEKFARSIVQSVLADTRSHTRPQEIYKSYDVHMPTLRPRWTYKPEQVCFLVDTSGSMMNDMVYVMPVISYLLQHNISVRLIAGDTVVTMDEEFTPGTSKLPEKVVGGGGTRITPLFTCAAEYDPRSIVCFTDGYVPDWPKDPGVPVLFVGTARKPPFGTVCS